MRADLRVDGLAIAHATVGGDDATSAVLRIYEQLDRADINAIVLSGVAVSWFNIINLAEVFDKIQKPLICVTYEGSMGLEKYINEYFPKPEKKLSLYKSLGPRERVKLKTGYEVFVRMLGCSADDARILLNKFTQDGRVPEPVRVARLAARATLIFDKSA